MSILAFATSTAECVDGDLPAGVSVVTTATNIAPYCDEGVSVGVGPLLLNFAAASEVWIDFYIYVSVGTTRPIAYLRSGSTNLFRITCPTSSTIRLDYWDGAAWVSGTASGGTLSSSNRYRISARVKMADANGALELYLDGALIGSFAGDTLQTVATTVDNLHLQAPGASNSVFSAVMVADEDTRAITYIARRPNGAGAAAEWTGAYTAIDETGFSDSDVVQSGTAGQVSTFGKAALPAEFSTGYSVMGIGVSARARRGVGLSNIQLAARSGSTNGFSSDKALGVAFAPDQHVFAQNPATSAAWTYAEADSAQIGVKSAA